MVGMPGAGKTTLLLCLLALASDITHEVFIFTSAFLSGKPELDLLARLRRRRRVRIVDVPKAGLPPIEESP